MTAQEGYKKYVESQRKQGKSEDLTALLITLTVSVVGALVAIAITK